MANHGGILTKEVTMERIIRDAIIGYKELFPEAPNDDCEKELIARAEFANKWLEEHGFEKEPFDMIEDRALSELSGSHDIKENAE